MAKIITNLSSVTTVGLDLAKHIFQIHDVDVCGRAIVSKGLRRKDVLVFFAQVPPCLVGLEACVSAIIGRVSCSSLAMTSGSCRRPMSSPMCAGRRMTRPTPLESVKR